VVYLLHLSEPLAGHARHYLGSAEDVEARLLRHASGHGAKMLRACRLNGIDWMLVRTWEGGRELERQLKRRHNSGVFCPICSPRKNCTV
jgi:predicted GIY-YIG superfamily endonuclease